MALSIGDQRLLQLAKYKIGDKVKIVGCVPRADYEHFFPIGTICKIISVADSDGDYELISIDGRRVQFVDPRDFQPETREQPIPPDRLPTYSEGTEGATVYPSHTEQSF